jgi:hypothetical protein
MKWGSPEKSLVLMMANVSKIQGNKYHIKGLYGTFRIDFSLQLVDGFDPWRSAFMKGSKEYYGPIIFDDENKTFLPVNPNRKKSLYWVSNVNQGVKSGTLGVPFIMTYYSRRDANAEGTN